LSSETPLAKKFNHSDVLNSEKEAGQIFFVLFIPSKDRNGKDLNNQEQWANAAGNMLTELFGGSTEMPPAKGKWFNPDTKAIITEPIILVHSYAKESDANDREKIKALAGFLHRMGRETNQGEIAVLIENIFHRITKFTLA
jgi:hypothetical protein